MMELGSGGSSPDFKAVTTSVEIEVYEYPGRQVSSLSLFLQVLHGRLSHSPLSFSALLSK